MKKNGFLKYLITFGVCAVLTFLYLIIEGVFTQTNTADCLKVIVNGFFSIGIVTVCFGLLVFISNNGAFDFFAYGIRRFFSLFQKNPNKVKYKTYFDYHEAKQQEEDRSFAFLVIIGGLFIIISLIVLIFWYQAK